MPAELQLFLLNPFFPFTEWICFLMERDQVQLQDISNNSRIKLLATAEQKQHVNFGKGASGSVSPVKILSSHNVKGIYWQEG